MVVALDGQCLGVLEWIWLCCNKLRSWSKTLRCSVRCVCLHVSPARQGCQISNSVLTVVHVCTVTVVGGQCLQIQGGCGSSHFRRQAS